MQNFCHSYFWGKFGPIIWISWNWLKFYRGVHCYMLTTVSMFIFSKIFSFIFFGKILSQNLKFFKLTDIWYRGRLLYAYFDFNVYFFKIFAIHIFWANLVQNLKFSKLTDIWYRRTLLYAYYDFNVQFFQIFCQLYFFGPIIWSSTKWLKFCRRVHCCMLITILMFIFSKVLSFI